MVTDGKRILTASTAAGPAFEGVNISSGTRAVDGAIVRAEISGADIQLETIANEAPIGLTGSGLLSLVYQLKKVGVIEASGRIAEQPPVMADRISLDSLQARQIQIEPESSLFLTQFDVRELQKAKGAIRAAINILMGRLGLEPADLERVILTGSFGGQVDVEAVLSLGMIPPVSPEAVENVANGAGFGAAMFLSDEGFARGVKIAHSAEQVDLDVEPDFMKRYVGAMALDPEEMDLP
jgi:uncharacterized 2Fe-2S/4Fe-4S cluster protein (DUF4445 family)